MAAEWPTGPRRPRRPRPRPAARSSPSPMTRIPGSVPDGRMSSRPPPPRRSRPPSMARMTSSRASVRRSTKRTFFSTCGSGSKRWHTSDTERSRRFTHRQHLQGRHEPVARGGIVGQDDVPGLLAADVEAVLAHVLQHVAVADRGAHHRQAEPLDVAFEPEVRHHRGDEAALAEPPVLHPALGDDGHQLVAVDDLALLVHHQQPVGVAVERDADVRRASRAPWRPAPRARSSRRCG